MPDMQTSGNDLKVERVRANLTVQDLAARMGVVRQTVWSIEKSAHVKPDRAAEYRAALVMSDDVTTEATA